EPRLRALRVGGQPLVLSRRECELLELLLRRAGEPIGKFELDQAIYGDNARHGSNSLEVLVHRLRRRLANSGSTAQLQTVRGVGYVLVEA
ncbi:helix-turn-helix domain-containing protein, partial [Klebsiella pneumoniae]